jgi:hypothetical protein
MALTTSTNAGFPTNIPGTLKKSTTNPAVDGVFVYLDGSEKWERIFDSGQKTYYASWLKTSGAPSDLTTLINLALADARVSIFIVDTDITVNGTVQAGGKVVEFVSGVVGGIGVINNADVRARWSYTFLGGTVTLTNCVFSSYTPRYASDSEANEKNIIYYYNTTTSKQRFKNASTWYDVITSIAQVTADSLQGDGSTGSPIKLDNDSNTPGNNKYYGTNISGTKGFFDLPATSNAITSGDSLQGDGTVGTPVKLDGDVNAPGNNYYYGTNGSGTKGFYVIPVQVTADSLQGDGTAGSPIKLDNDNNAPGNNKVYRTDGSGVKGWSDFPAASSTVNVQYSVAGDGSVGTPLQLSGDAATPGNSKYYGTDSGGTKGFFSLPTISVTVTNSLNGDGTGGSPIQLDGDVNAPGNLYYYGTNGSGTKGFYTIPVQSTTNSLTGDGTAGTPIKLVNDTASPGNNKVYRTDGSGVRGWADFPAASSTINTTESITGDGSGGTPAKLVGDAATPGNSKYYGTNSGGTKGFYDIVVTSGDSITGTGTAASPVKLSGDTASPGNNKVYGTNGSGTKGWNDFPTPTVTVTNSLNGTGTGGSPIQLDGDVDAPGNSYYYGTNASGTKGFFVIPSGGAATITTSDSLNGDGSGGSPVRLDGDNNAPGNNYYYGTNGAGAKGFYTLPTVDGSETKVQAGTNVTVSGTGTVGSPYTINSTFTVTPTNSITGAGTGGSPLQLSGDSGAPGASKYYGTDAGGTKGWYTIAIQYTNVSNSITGDGVGSPVRLVGDNTSPGNNFYYGTNGSGTKGFYTLPTVDGSETKVNAGTNVTVSGTGTTGSPYVINASFAAAVQSSVVGTGAPGNPLQLSGDAGTPGATRYYGTNGAGTKGFYAIPVYDGSETKVTAGSNVTVSGSGTVGSPYVVAAAAASPVYAAKSNLTSSGTFAFTYVKATTGFEICDKVLKMGHPTSDDLRTITLQAMVYIDSFATGSWTEVAVIPTGYRPSGLTVFPISSLVPGVANPATTPIRGSDGTTGIINGCVYSDSSAYIDPSDGKVFVRIQSISATATLGGTSVIVLPLNVTYFININT